MIHNLPHFSLWDYAAIAVISLQGLAVAYANSPRLKALIFTLPIPFTMTTLALGRPVDATNLAGLVLLLIYANTVRLLHCRLRLPIVISITLSVAVYCTGGWILAKRIPSGDASFWIALSISTLIAIITLLLTPKQKECADRSPCPVWIKLPVIIAVITGLMLAKRELSGFTTMFPMMGIITAYEARTCLGTISRQVPIFMLMALPLLLSCRLAYPHFGLAGSLVIGWLAFLAVLIPHLIVKSTA